MFRRPMFIELRLRQFGIVLRKYGDPDELLWLFCRHFRLLVRTGGAGGLWGVNGKDMSRM